MIINHIVNKIIFKFARGEKICDYYRRMGVEIGHNCEIYKNVVFGSEPYLITVGNNVRITNGVRFITHDGGLWVLRNLNLAHNMDSFGKIVVGNNVHIGMNAIIMPNVTIGDNVVIGCGCVVTKNIPDNSVVVGVPGRVIETIEEYYEKNKGKFLPTKNLTPAEKKDIVKKYFSKN